MIHVFVVYVFGWRVLSLIGIMKHGGPDWGDEYDFGHVEFKVFMKHTKGGVLLAVEGMCLEFKKTGLGVEIEIWEPFTCEWYSKLWELMTWFIE